MKFRYADVKQLAEATSLLQEKVDFLMGVTHVTIKIGHPLDPLGTKEVTITAEELFKELKYRGGKIVNVPADQINQATTVLDTAPEGAGDGASDAEAEDSTTGESLAL